MSRRVLDLSSLKWQFGQAPRRPFSASPRDDRPAVSAWMPAAVPGDVRADLIAAGRIPPIDTPDGIAAGSWADGCDWWYRAELPSSYAPDDAVVLEADGIDFQSAIWLDGQLLATHAGMFSRQHVILSPRVNTPGPHELAIRVWGAGALPRLRDPLPRRALRWLIGRLSPGAEYFPHRMATPKAQYSFGWDFAPRVLSTGIWDDLRLVTARRAYIEDLWVHGQPLTEQDDPTPVFWRVRLRVVRWQPGTARAEVRVEPENFAGSGYQSVTRSVELCSDSAVPCVDDHELVLDMPFACRWWPWDQGESCLYRVTVRLVDDQGEMDRISRVTGVRSVARTDLREGAPWRFVINGRPLFLRGANWVPADMLPGRVQPEDYTRLIGLAKEAGVNFLRVWGGGIREKRAFWETCDRLGIMAWQEFPLACAFLDHYPKDLAYHALLADETRGIARALRNHPSLVAWCGGNEISTAREAGTLDVIVRTLIAEDATRPYIPASPSDGDVHEWQVWHGGAPWTDLACAAPPFMSEFGLQALPDRRTVQEMFPHGAPRTLADARWAARKAQVAKLRHYAGPDAERGLEAAIAATQRAQAAGLQAGLEACRLRREPAGDRAGSSDAGSETALCGGVAFWQLNEPWPAVSWSVIDRAGRPKAAYEMLRRSFQPILIAARFPWRAYGAGETFQAQIWLVNDGPETWPDCLAEVTLDGAPVWRADGLTLEPACARRVGEFARELTAPPQALELRLIRGDATLATNRYDLSVPLPPAQPWRSRALHSLGTRLIDTV